MVTITAAVKIQITARFMGTYTLFLLRSPAPGLRLRLAARQLRI
jgi:hypothetical protein